MLNPCFFIYVYVIRLKTENLSELVWPNWIAELSAFVAVPHFVPGVLCCPAGVLTGREQFSVAVAVAYIKEQSNDFR